MHNQIIKDQLYQLKMDNAMQYISTRGNMPLQTFSQVLLGGLAPDGGLVTAQHYPTFTLTDLQALAPLSYPALAFEIISPFVGDIASADLKALINSAYTATIFGSEAITPITQLEPDLYLLGLSNGPTLAFKDIAMQLLGPLFEYVLTRENRILNIVGATSGDTGSAAEYAMRGKKRIHVFMLSPHNKMSAFQRAQMFSLQDANIHNIAIEGLFDTCQDIVKALNQDAQFKSSYHIGAVNSINWGRIVAQIVYYFKAYFAITDRIGEPVNFVVPSGNFGNICAGHIAKQMGLPIQKLIVATNENDVLYEFFRTGKYHVRSEKETYSTSSPSMDISKASNLERFVFDLVDRDSHKLCQLWQTLAQQGEFNLADTPYFTAMQTHYGFSASRSTHQDRLASILDVYQRYQLIIDPHTADGYKAALEHRSDVPTILLETALPAKFTPMIQAALGQSPPLPAALKDLEAQPQRVTVLPASLSAVQAYIKEKAPR
jgi:threonine synthase